MSMHGDLFADAVNLLHVLNYSHFPSNTDDGICPPSSPLFLFQAVA